MEARRKIVTHCMRCCVELPVAKLMVGWRFDQSVYCDPCTKKWLAHTYPSDRVIRVLE